MRLGCLFLGSGTAVFLLLSVSVAEVVLPGGHLKPLRPKSSERTQATLISAPPRAGTRLVLGDERRREADALRWAVRVSKEVQWWASALYALFAPDPQTAAALRERLATCDFVLHTYVVLRTVASAPHLLDAVASFLPMYSPARMLKDVLAGRRVLGPDEGVILLDVLRNVTTLERDDLADVLHERLLAGATYLAYRHAILSERPDEVYELPILAFTPRDYGRLMADHRGGKNTAMDALGAKILRSRPSLAAQCYAVACAAGRTDLADSLCVRVWRGFFAPPDPDRHPVPLSDEERTRREAASLFGKARYPVASLLHARGRHADAALALARSSVVNDALPQLVEHVLSSGMADDFFFCPAAHVRFGVHLMLAVVAREAANGSGPRSNRALSVCLALVEWFGASWVRAIRAWGARRDGARAAAVVKRLVRARGLRDYHKMCATCDWAEDELDERLDEHTPEVGVDA